MDSTTPAGMAGNPLPPSTPAVTAKPKLGKPSLADVLAKQASGAALTAQERGILGAEKRKQMAKFQFTPAPENELVIPPAASQPAPQTTQPVPVAANAQPAPVALPTNDNPLLAASQPADLLAGAESFQEFSGERLRAAAEALCDSIDGGGQLFIGWAAESAGANAQTAAKYESAVALQPRNRKLMVEGSEPVIRLLCRLFKVAPEKLADAMKGSGFAVGAIAHAFLIRTAYRSLAESQAELKRKQKEQQNQPQPAA